MRNSNKFLIGLFITAILFVICGAFVKLEGENGDVFLLSGILLKITAIIGILYNNRKQVTALLS